VPIRQSRDGCCTSKGEIMTQHIALVLVLTSSLNASAFGQTIKTASSLNGATLKAFSYFEQIQDQQFDDDLRRIRPAQLAPELRARVLDMLPKDDLVRLSAQGPAEQMNLLCPVPILLSATRLSLAQASKKPEPAENSNDVVALSDKGAAYVEAGHYTKAIEAYKQVIRLRPDCAEAHLNLGLVYSLTRQYKESIGAYKQAILLKPDFARAHNALGIAYDKSGRYQEATLSFGQAIQINPRYFDALNNLGLTQVKSGRYKQAIESFSRAVSIKADFADAHYNLRGAYYKTGQNKRAIEARKRTIELQPNLADAHFLLGVVYLAAKNNDAALEQYRLLKTLAPDLATTLLSQVYKDRIVTINKDRF
jgi:tetratricopeptide (TPR) repeat protein